MSTSTVLVFITMCITAGGPPTMFLGQEVTQPHAIRCFIFFQTVGNLLLLEYNYTYVHTWEL